MPKSSKVIWARFFAWSDPAGELPVGRAGQVTRITNRRPLGVITQPSWRAVEFMEERETKTSPHPASSKTFEWLLPVEARGLLVPFRTLADALKSWSAHERAARYLSNFSPTLWPAQNANSSSRGTNNKKTNQVHGCRYYSVHADSCKPRSGSPEGLKSLGQHSPTTLI